MWAVAVLVVTGCHCFWPSGPAELGGNGVEMGQGTHTRHCFCVHSSVHTATCTCVHTVVYLGLAPSTAPC